MIVKGDDRGDPALTKRLNGVRFLIGAGSSHTKDIKMVVVPACMVLRMK